MRLAMRRNFLRFMVVLSVVAGLIIGIRALVSDEASYQGQQRVSKLTPVDSGDLAAVKQWVVLRCRGRTVADLSRLLQVEPTMEVVAKRITRAIPSRSRSAAIKICERELKRSERD